MRVRGLSQVRGLYDLVTDLHGKCSDWFGDLNPLSHFIHIRHPFSVSSTAQTKPRDIGFES